MNDVNAVFTIVSSAIGVMATIAYIASRFTRIETELKNLSRLFDRHCEGHNHEQNF